MRRLVAVKKTPLTKRRSSSSWPKGEHVWLDLRREIGRLFASLTATQYSVLVKGEIYYPSQFWTDRGEVVANQGRRSIRYQWQSDLLHARLRREEQALERARRRARAERKRASCRTCGQPLDHRDRQNVRVYCDERCRRSWDRKRAASIEPELALRGCVVCGNLFRARKHQRKSVCGKRCGREQNLRAQRARRRAMRQA